MTRLIAPKGGCVVRAYRQGLGDCFLLAFANQRPQQHYVLVDCGVLLGTEDADATMKRVADDIAEATDRKLHALVVTHQHWDHISGFGQAAREFNQIEVKELWVSWAEREDDPLAHELLERYGVALRALCAAEPKVAASDSSAARRTRSILRFLGPLGENKRLTTDGIMQGILNRFKTVTRFCTPGDTPHRIPGLPNVSFFVLGPPRDITYIRKSRPSSGDVYLEDPRTGASASILAAVEASSMDFEPWEPFAESYDANHDESSSRARRSSVGSIKDHYASEPWRIIDHDWLDGVGDLAIKLDSHLNNTSLVLAIELEEDGRVLLFPGDAQVGNWRSWHNVTWKDRPSVSAKDLLGRTVFYKVGHHASHNATLGEKGLEMMTSPDLRAVIPLDREMARRQRWDMPYHELLARLESRTDHRTYITDDGPPHDLVVRETDLYADFEFPGA